MSGPDMLLEADYIRKQDLHCLSRSEGTGSQMRQSNLWLNHDSERASLFPSSCCKCQGFMFSKALFPCIIFL